MRPSEFIEKVAYGGEELKSHSAPRPTAREVLVEWRLKIESCRQSEKQCLAHGWPDRSKWYEGQADALERCADQLEYWIMPQLEQPVKSTGGEVNTRSTHRETGLACDDCAHAWRNATGITGAGWCYMFRGRPDLVNLCPQRSLLPEGEK